MARPSADPFGFAAAINWDVVDVHEKVIAQILGVNMEEEKDQ